MIYLLAKMSLFLLLAVGLGFALGWWWVRRQFQDVTDEYAQLLSAGPTKDYSMAFDDLGQDLEDRHDQLSTQIRGIEGRLRDLVAAEVSRARPVDSVTPIDVNGIERSLGKLKATLEPIEKRLAAVESALTSQVAGRTNGESRRLDARFESLQSGLHKLETLGNRLNGGFETRLEALESALENRPNESIRLEELVAAVKELRSSLSSERDVAVAPSPPPLVATPLNGARSGGGVSSVVDAEVISPQVIGPAKPSNGTSRRRSGPVVFKSAAHGPKDDLKQISGVGTVLEKLLNDHGVFYFFQVAAWSRSDVQQMDDQLGRFKGRIGRDNWVRQAKQLAASSPARPPANEGRGVSERGVRRAAR